MVTGLGWRRVGIKASLEARQKGEGYHCQSRRKGIPVCLCIYSVFLWYLLKRGGLLNTGAVWQLPM